MILYKRWAKCQHFRAATVRPELGPAVIALTGSR
jgi:hypothetical protein